MVVYSTLPLIVSGEPSSGTEDDANTKSRGEKSASLTEEKEDNLWAGPAKITEDKSRFLVQYQ